MPGHHPVLLACYSLLLAPYTFLPRGRHIKFSSHDKQQISLQTKDKLPEGQGFFTASYQATAICRSTLALATQLDFSSRQVFAVENEANLSSLPRCLLNCKHMLLPRIKLLGGAQDNGQS